MSIDKATVEQIAKLAKLEFDDTSKEEIMKDLDRMLQFVDKLNELNTANVEPLTHITEEQNVLRTDVVKTEISQAEALKNAPHKDSDYFIVPKVLTKEDR
ncbi:MAG TPA: Asp-tRNA(Asn)/Glu-tRNA(Gln) amidotransferase subunit GatC [Flavobacteriales bacterium]|jgi:aspartyl-tRNA(Asn)/glutamyl-tRNA(Gln) amidotransferase subunit C|nr:Asp-tRNA(Asn)/Glu-tRNA(Gln) amidotransferase subunit GatC [Flavobacteriales bacterium]HIA11015.1 Asp-tRNA(Asn)/Glu-tRNA(Gln) amidotransferase subunit GatC [Flavobacteriales bacterium]